MDENDTSNTKVGNAISESDPSTGRSLTAESAPKHTLSVAPKSRKGLLILLISIAVLLGLFALAYVYWFQSPNKVVADGLSHAFAAESLTYTGMVTTVGATKMNVDFNGGMSTDGGMLNAAFAFDTNDKKYTFDSNGLVDTKGDLYLKVKSIDELVANYRSAVPADAQPLFDRIIDKIDNKWIKISADDIKEFDPDLAKTQECVASTYKKLQTDEATKSELRAVYKKHPFIVVDRVLGAEEGSLGYTLNTDRATFKEFAKEYKTTPLYKSLQGCDGRFTLDKDIKVDERTAQVDVWFDRWSHRITRIVTKDSEDGQTTNVSIKPAFNRPVTVTTPKDATTIEQLQKDIMSLLQTAQQSSINGAPAMQTAPASAS